MSKMIITTLAFLIGSACTVAPQPSKPTLIVYAYDSLVGKPGKGGLGDLLKQKFEASCSCELRLVASGDGAQMISRLELDALGGNPTAHVLLGLDQISWSRAKDKFERWGEWTPKNYDQVSGFAKIEDGFLPFDYGVMALMMDQKKMKKITPPASLQDLIKPSLKGKFLLEDPRTSTPGLGFLLFTAEILQDETETYWKRLRGQWLTLPTGWSTAYALFMKEEAPLVWSYTTSQAYHRMKGGDSEGRYIALVFDEGNPIQIEGAAMVKPRSGNLTPEDRERAQLFFDLLLSEEIQKEIFEKQWMYSVLKSLPQPKEFANLPKPKKTISLTRSASKVQEILNHWGKTVSGH